VSGLHERWVPTEHLCGAEEIQGNLKNKIDISFSPYRAVNTVRLSQSMLDREITAVCSQIHTKHVNTLCGQNVEMLNIKPGGTYSDHRSLDSEHSETLHAAHTRCCYTSCGFHNKH